jgi:O-antigen ligase
MKQIILKYNTQFFFFFLIGISFLPVLPTGVESTLMFSGLLLSFFYFIFEGKKFWNKKKTIQLVFFSSLFLIFSFSLLYTEDFKNGIKFIIRLLPTLLFPLIFLFNKEDTITKDHSRKIINAFCFAVLLALVYLHIVLWNKLYKSETSFWEFRQLIESRIKVHGTYLTMWVGLAVIILIYKIKNEIVVFKNYKKAFLVSLVVVYFFYWQFIIGARMPFFSTIIVCLFILFNTVNKTKTAIFSFLIISISVFLVLKNDRIGERFKNLRNYNFSFPEGKYEDNYPNISNEQIRNGIYFCSFENIKLEPFFGYGAGDVDAKLQSCYDETFTNTDTYKVIHYNSHNEYLNILLSSGIIGLVLFLFSKIYFLRKAAAQKNYVYISFICYIFLNFCFENILSRHDGVIFYSFFNSLFFFQYNNLNEKSTN